MSPSPFRLRAAGKTDVGKRRRQNEDAFVCDTKRRIFAVADGMGGHAAGEVASAMAIKTMMDFIATREGQRDTDWPFETAADLSTPERVLVNALMLANRVILEDSLANPERGGMGTTLSCCWVRGKEAIFAHVGDSRALLLRNGSLEQITEDHTWINEQVHSGHLTAAQAKGHPRSNILTRALGTHEKVEVDHLRRPLRPGDTLLLTSDGLTGPLAPKEITAALTECGADAEAACDRLIEAANARGGPDNITAVVIHLAPTKGKS